MYRIADYGSMITDPVRFPAYRRALEQTVNPGDVVLEIGAGPGVFALLAARLGARRVIAVEPDDSVELARELARANGLEDRVEVVRGLSTELELDEPAQVIVSDLRGVVPLLGRHLPSVIDARDRLLAPGGTLIPARDDLWCVVVESSEEYRKVALPWRDGSLGLDLRAGAAYTTNSCWRARLPVDALLGEPRRWAELDYRTLQSSGVGGGAQISVTRPGTGHGLCVWFSTELVDGAGFSSAPDQPETIYGRLFFPWSEPVPLAPGDEVAVTLDASLVDDDYVWRWRTDVRGGEVAFDQTALRGVPLNADRVRKRAAGHVPALSDDGEVARFALGLMDGALPLGDVAAKVAEQFPDRFPDAQSALNRVAQLSLDYSR